MKISLSSKHVFLLLLIVFALSLSACAGATATTEAPVATEEVVATEETTTATEEVVATEETTTETEEAVATEETTTETEEAAAVTSSTGMVASTIPCNATIVTDQGNLVRAIRQRPTVAADVIRATRPGTEFVIAEIVRNDEGLWYRLTSGGLSQGFIQPEFLVLGEDCAAVEDAG